MRSNLKWRVTFCARAARRRCSRTPPPTRHCSGRRSNPTLLKQRPPTARTIKSLEPLDIISEDWAGNVNAFEVSAEGGGSAIEETAILFANGLIEPAEAGLRAAIQSDQLGESAQRGWLMLFELLQQRGDRAGFDSLTIEYVLRFESSPPAWIDYRDELRSGSA